MLIYARMKTSLMAILRNESYEIVSNFQTNKNPIVLRCELNVDHCLKVKLPAAYAFWVLRTSEKNTRERIFSTLVNGRRI